METQDNNRTKTNKAQKKAIDKAIKDKQKLVTSRTKVNK